MGRGYRSFSTFSENDSNTICDVTGFKTKISNVVKRWEGFMVIPEAFHTRQPQDFPVVPVKQTVYPARTEIDTFGSDACKADVSWAQQTSGVTRNLNSIWENNGIWMAVGDIGTIITSSDAGVSWSTLTSGVSKDLNAVKYWNGQWWVVGDGSNFVSATVLKSSDGISWSSVTVGSTKGFFEDIAINDTTMAFFGHETEDFTVYTYSTTDGIIFTENVLPGTIQTSYSLIWNETDKLWGAGGDTGQANGEWFGTSPDLISWTKMNVSSGGAGDKISGIDHDGSNWIVTASPSLIYTSLNASIWEQRAESNMPADYAWDISNDGGCVVLLCGGSTVGKIIISDDNGSTWNLSYTSDTSVSSMHQAHYAQGIWIAVGNNGRIITSITAVDSTLEII